MEEKINSNNFVSQFVDFCCCKKCQATHKFKCCRKKLSEEDISSSTVRLCICLMIVMTEAAVDLDSSILGEISAV